MTRNVLSMKEQMFLGKVMEENYISSGLDDVAFVKYANEHYAAKFRAPLGVTHIRSMRIALNIEPNRPRRKVDSTGECLGLIARVQELEERVSKLAETIKGMKK